MSRKIIDKAGRCSSIASGMRRSSTYAIETLALHGGQTADPATGSRALPLYQTTSFNFHNTDHAAELFALTEAGNIYTRISNPTTEVFEKRMHLMEHGVGSLATSSGQSAITTSLLTIMSQGDHIVSASTLYGGTHHLFSDTLPKIGITTTFVSNPNDIESMIKAIQPNTKAIYAETIGNPSLNVLDIEAVANLAKDVGIPLIVDSTFTTPYICNPIDFGANIVVHSATKFIGGHGTSIAGVIVDGGNFDWTLEKFRSAFTTPDASYGDLTYAGDFGTLAFITRARVQIMRDIGACISPFNSWCLIQGLETLPIRMKESSKNAQIVADFLKDHPMVVWINYPTLESHPTTHLVPKYFKNGMGGAMVVFGIKGGRASGMHFIEKLALWSHVANVGDSKSLVIHPASTTHQQLSKEALEQAGIGEDLIRLSVGLENVDDLIADLDQALNSVEEQQQTVTMLKDNDIKKKKHVVINDEGFIRSVCTSSEYNSERNWRIGVVGLSAVEGRPSYRVARKMQRLGYKIIPINPNSETILNEKCYKSIQEAAEAGEQVDILQLFRSAKYAEAYASEAVKYKDKLKLQCLWLQEGIINEDAAKYVLENGDGLKVVMNRCTYKECQRFMGPMIAYLAPPTTH